MTVMGTRGMYSKSLARREEILTTALKVIADRGFNSATLRDLADAANLSITGLVHHFGTKEALLTEVLRRRDEDTSTRYIEGARSAREMMERLEGLISYNASVPGLMKLYTNLSADATSPDHPGHEYFLERYEASRRLGQEAIEDLQESGALPKHFDAESLGVLITAALDGLQLQLLYNPDLDMSRYLNTLGDLLDSTVAAADRDAPAS